ncbi:ParB-like partition protein [Candidatus Nitrososphaera evergladensis SR1]|uniref:ParB-like partition protein n=1 Tax=Candidatus Nitrososphaera evergladensis SR1 TaxID=1459636 RepID=A0A075MMR3_9ARCH|nr:ParB/RepB/Spo0J family partition protein [Candidatus Nitrososphaera evergladensis]AIF82568.1 ParB-like partition protein [Candidatus Nitrososphaera evergladensis SR1]
MSNSLGLLSSSRGLIQDINISQVRYSATPIRVQKESIAELADSIRENGLLQPILVRPKDGYFEIVAGNRRCKACEILKWRKITCHVVELDDKAAFECSIIENIQRETLSVIEEAEAFKRYVTDFGWGGVSELAKGIGKSPSYITKKIKLLDMPSDVISSIIDSSLNSSVAEELCSVKDPTKQSELAALINKRHLSLRKTRELVNQYKDEEGGIESRDVERRRRAFDKMIVILRVALNNTGQVISDNDDDWVVREMLMHHKNVLHEQIDILIREKVKLGHHALGN